MSPLEAALIVVPSALTLLGALYVRATSKKIDASLMAVLERCSGATRSLNTADLQPIPACAPSSFATLQDCDLSVTALTPGYISHGRGTPGTMKDRAHAILQGLHDSIGAEGPTTSPEDRERLAWPFRAARSPSAIAGLLGITLVADDLPPEDPQWLVCRTLLYRDDEDATMWVLFGLAGEICLRDDLEANEADRWLLAECLGERLADAEPLFDRAVRSTVRDARA